MCLRRFVLPGIYKTALVFLLVISLSVSAVQPKKAEANPLAVALGGLAVGEALFYASAIFISGYTLYEAYDKFTNDSLTSQFVRVGAKKIWDSTTSAVKEEWAALEAGVVAGATTISLTASQWATSIKAGLLSWGTSRTVTPAIPLPGENYVNNAPVDNAFMVKYAVLNFTMNGEKFALMPYTISKSTSTGSLTYNWYHLETDGNWKAGVIPSAAIAFTPIDLKIVWAPNYDNLAITYKGTAISLLTYSVSGWDAALKQILDSLPTIHGLLVQTYGGLTVSIPTGWADTGWAYPIPQEKDLTKPVAIPIPTGAISYPNVGEGKLTLTGEQIKTGIGTMTGEITGPGGGENGENPPKNPWAPWALVTYFFDMLRAMLAYCVRLFTFITTIPLIPAIPLKNTGFEFLMNWKIGVSSRYFPNLLPINVKFLTLIQTMISIFLSFIVFKVIRRFFGGG